MQYFLQLCQHDGASALKTMEQILSEGKDGQRFIEDLISFIRDVLLYQESPDLLNVTSTGLTDEDFQQLAQAGDTAVLYQMIDILNKIQDEMRFTTHPDVYLEVMTIRLCQVKDQAAVNNQAGPTADSAVVQQLQAQVAQLQQQLAALQTAGGPATTAASSAPRPSRPQVSHPASLKVNVSQVNHVLENATQADIDRLKGDWGDIVSLLDAAQRSLVGLSKPVAASPEGVVVTFNNDFLLKQASVGSLADNLSADIQQVEGEGRKVVFVPEAQWPNLRRDYLIDHGYQVDKQPQDSAAAGSQGASNEAQAATNEIEQTARKLFGDGQVEIKND